jgi:hypothetical protein
MPTETVNDTVTVSLDEIIGTDLEGFLDLLETLVNAGTDDGPLSDISYEVLGLGAESNTLVISVIAQQEIEDDPDDLMLDPTN